jgi:hypothetical protein
MLFLRRCLSEGRSRILALRERFKLHFSEDDCEARGLKLLREWLSPEQLAQFDAEGHFDVIGSDSGKKYRIHSSSPVNIDELDDQGHPRLCYCLVTEIYVVPGDLVLAQKIALETGEREALSVANRFGPKRRPSGMGLPH